MNTSSNTMLNQIGLVCSVIGAICVVVSGLKIFRRRAVLLHGIAKKGVVLRLRIVSSEDRNTIIPVIQYEDTSGNVHERSLPATHDESLFKVGKSVDLIYERGNPKNVVDYRCRYQDVYMAMIISLLLLAFGLVMYSCITESTNQANNPNGLGLVDVAGGKLLT